MESSSEKLNASAETLERVKKFLNNDRRLTATIPTVQLTPYKSDDRFNYSNTERGEKILNAWSTYEKSISIFVITNQTGPVLKLMALHSWRLE